MHSFSGWKIAFEVQVKLREYKKTHAITDCCLRERESVGEYVNQQLILDFETARFCPERSRLPGLCDTSRYHLTRSKRQALLHYITRYYFAELRQQGHHVLYTFPVWKAGGSCGFNRFAPSNFSFQFYGPSFGCEDSGALVGPQRGSGNRNMIIIGGIIDKRKRCPSSLPPCKWNWCSSQDVFTGVVMLSRDVFLEGWLLEELLRVNERTTIVPIFDGIHDSGDWRFELLTLQECYAKGGETRSCERQDITDSCGGLQFEHRNKERWTYDKVGDACDIYHNGGYSVSCETVNKLVVPTATKCGGIEIKFSGTVTLKLSFKGNHKSWSSSAVARWSYTIFIIGGALGCGPTIKTKPTYEVTGGSGFMGDYQYVHENIKDASTLLKEKLRDISIIEDTTIEELRTTFCGVWPLFYSGSCGYTLCNPYFNQCGDLIFELESPLDFNGEVVVSGRKDICLPSKRHGHVRPSISINRKEFEESEETDVREASFSTTTTRREDSPVTPAFPPTHLHPNVQVRAEAESSEDGEYIDSQKFRRTSHEKVFRTTERREIGSGRLTPIRY